jgi:tetratricopeptide (TPR) repeat protein
LIINLNSGWICWLANRLDDAMAQVHKMIELEPRFFGAYWQMGAIYWAQGKPEEAIEAYKKSLSLNCNQITLGNLGFIYGAIGKRDEAQGVLNQLFEMKERQNVIALNLAKVYCGLDENDKAVEWLERAIEERNAELVYFELETKVGTTGGALGKSLKDPRIVELLRRVGLMSESPG